jgi:hypothetical protein
MKKCYNWKPSAQSEITYSDIVVILLEFTNLDTASDLGEQGKTKHRQGDRNFLVAGEGPIDDQSTKLALCIEARASVILQTGTAASTGEAGGTGLATELQVQAT